MPKKNRTHFAQRCPNRTNDALFFKTISTFVAETVRAPERAKVVPCHLHKVLSAVRILLP